MDASKIKQKMLEPLKVTRVAKRMGQMDKPGANVGVSKAGVTILDKRNAPARTINISAFPYPISKFFGDFDNYRKFP